MLPRFLRVVGFVAATAATTASRGMLGAPTPLQLALDAAIASGAPSFSLSPNAVYAQGPSSLVLSAANFTLYGANATLIFAPGYGVVVDRSVQTTAQDMTINFDPPSFSQGSLVASTPSTFDVRIDAGFPLPNASFFTSVEFKLQFYDPTTGQRPHQSGCCIVTVSGESQPGVWRVAMVQNGCGCPVPQLPGGVSPRATISSRIFSYGYQIPEGYRGGAWWVFNSSRVTTRRVTLLGSSNFAFSEWGGEGGNVYDGVVLARGPGHLLSSNTDGFHSFATGLGPTVVNSDIAWMGDDVMSAWRHRACARRARDAMLASGARTLARGAHTLCGCVCALHIESRARMQTSTTAWRWCCPHPFLATLCA